ncbi:unnamed protein product [Caenorhabditis sp. 36 PRJEB53466]|nr:unnamed protein product [Caenorhabditis sp. 36 PRJEB53466]
MMSLKVLSTWSLFSLFIVGSATKTVCNGTELSVRSDLELGLLTEKPCTHVYGDIVIANLVNAKRMPSYWTITELYGSLIIENTTDLADSVNLQNLRVILANVRPAIVLRNNKNLKLAIGARLNRVSTQANICYWFTNNWPAYMTESQHYTLHKAAIDKRPIFFTQNHFLTGTCPEMSYKFWTISFASMCFVASLLLIGVSCYGRPQGRKIKVS